MNYKIEQTLQQIKNQKDIFKKLNLVKFLKDVLLLEYIKIETEKYLKEMRK